MRVLRQFLDSLSSRFPRRRIPAVPLTIVLAALVGVLGGYGSVLFTRLIGWVTDWTVEPIVRLGSEDGEWLAILWMVPALGLLFVAWFTRRFAPEAQGHGVPEVIYAVARHDGVIRLPGCRW